MTYKLYAFPSGSALVVDAQRPLLEQLQAAGWRLSSSCRNGNCGLCETELLAGQVELTGGNIRRGGTIPLCTAHARSDIQLRPPPMPATSAVYACQWLRGAQDELFLLLPAGRQPELGAGDTCALLLPERVIRAPVELLGQRKLLIVLREAPLLNRPLALPTLPVLLPLSTRKPTWQLWHQAEDQVAQCLWHDISPGDAQAAIHYYRRQQTQDRWWLKNTA